MPTNDTLRTPLAAAAGRGLPERPATDDRVRARARRKFVTVRNATRANHAKSVFYRAIYGRKCRTNERLPINYVRLAFVSFRVLFRFRLVMQCLGWRHFAEEEIARQLETGSRRRRRRLEIVQADPIGQLPVAPHRMRRKSAHARRVQTRCECKCIARLARCLATMTI